MFRSEPFDIKLSDYIKPERAFLESIPELAVPITLTSIFLLAQISPLLDAYCQEVLYWLWEKDWPARILLTFIVYVLLKAFALTIHDHQGLSQKKCQNNLGINTENKIQTA